MITLKIKTSNAAFDKLNFGAEVSRILGTLAIAANDWDKYESIDNGIYDVNGNTVGQIQVRGYADD